MDTLYPHCAGLDVHKDTVVACVRHHVGAGRPRQEVRTFATHTQGLIDLADWLVAEGVTHAAMESHRRLLEAGLQPPGRPRRGPAGQRPAHQAGARAQDRRRPTAPGSPSCSSTAC